MSIQSVVANFVLRYQMKRKSESPINVPKTRHVINKMAKKYPPPPKDITHTPVPAQPNHALCSAEWLSVAKPKRTVLYFHGGGYFFCGLDTHRPTCAYLARTAEARVLSVDYRMAPEHVFPAAVDDAVAWWKELLRQGMRPEERCSPVTPLVVAWLWPAWSPRAIRACRCLPARCSRTRSQPSLAPHRAWAARWRWNWRAAAATWR
jgi:hypothetical protein